MRVGNMVILIMTLYYIEDMVLDSYIRKHYSETVLKHISIIFNFSNISLLLSLIFIFMIYNEREYTKIYSKLNQKIFSLKIVLDMYLIFNYIYNLYYEFNDQYLKYINNTSHIVLVVLVLHYMIIFMSLFAKANFKLDKVTYDSIFKSLDDTRKVTGKDTPYYEIKFLKVIYVHFRK